MQFVAGVFNFKYRTLIILLVSLPEDGEAVRTGDPTNEKIIMSQNDKLVNTNPVIKDHIFKTNKNFPNSRLPLLIYKKACLLGKQRNKAAGILQKLFNKNNWKNSWSNGIYSFHHYHSNTHECMGIA